MLAEMRLRFSPILLAGVDRPEKSMARGQLLQRWSDFCADAWSKVPRLWRPCSKSAEGAKRSLRRTSDQDTSASAGGASEVSPARKDWVANRDRMERRRCKTVFFLDRGRIHLNRHFAISAQRIHQLHLPRRPAFRLKQLRTPHQNHRRHRSILHFPAKVQVAWPSHYLKKRYNSRGSADTRLACN